MLTRHEHVRAMLSDTRFSSDRRDPRHPSHTPYMSGHRQQLIEMDPPDHTRLRRSIVGEFTVQRLAKWRPRIQEIVDEAIDAMLAGPAEVDLVEALSLPVLSVATLLDKREHLAALRDDPRLTVGAVEELLRYFTIAEIGAARLATEDVEIGGVLIRAGEGVLGLTNTANRDASVFPEPNDIDFTRMARNHLAFGFGPHQCLGQNLARLELEIVLATLVRRIPTLRLATPFDEIPFKEDGPNYGVFELKVAW
ncbi:hypothetical protein GCM10022221_63340 [Actinocorallia aurea]